MIYEALAEAIESRGGIHFASGRSRLSSDLFDKDADHLWILFEDGSDAEFKGFDAHRARRLVIRAMRSDMVMA